MKDVVKFSFLLYGCVLLFPAMAHNKVDVEEQRQLWLGYQNRLHFSKKWLFLTDIDERLFILPNRQFQLLIPGINIERRFKNGFNVSLGLGYFYNSLPTDTSPVTGASIEWRPHLQAVMTSNLGRSEIIHRYRFEERFSRVVNDDNSGVWDFSMRTRYQLQWQYNLKKDSDRFKFFVFDEILLNVDADKIFDQNRISAGFQCGITEWLRASLSYMNLLQQSSTANFYNRHILRLTLTHDIYLYNRDTDGN